MTKYTARVTGARRAAKHAVGKITQDGDPAAVAEFAAPDRVVIRLEEGGDGACFMLRYDASGRFCGDTWHETLRAAFEQARFEYGLTEASFSREDE